MKILITGTPASGKTSIAKELSFLLKTKYVDVKEIIKNNPGTIEGIEEEEMIIKPALKKILEKNLFESCVFETHLIEYCPKADITIILRTKPSVLKKRMTKRGYSLKKIRDNLEVEIIDYFTQLVNSKKVIEFDSSKGSAKNNAKKILRLINSKKFNLGKIKHSEKEIKKALVQLFF